MKDASISEALICVSDVVNEGSKTHICRNNHVLYHVYRVDGERNEGGERGS